MATAILISGVSGAGKTHYANALGYPMLSYDAVHHYPTNVTDYDAIRQWVDQYRECPQVTIDAWGLWHDKELATLGTLVAPRTLEVRYLYMTPLHLHLAQLQKQRDGLIELTAEQNSLGTHARQIMRELACSAKDILEPLAKQGMDVQWWFREEGTEASKEHADHFYRTLAVSPTQELLAWIDATSHDPLYQAIEIDGHEIRPGYMKSGDLWRTIQSLGIDWQDKSVCDLGCFNGYFSFKAERAGASRVVGYDRDEAAEAVFRRLALLHKSQAEFVHADLSSPGALADDYDIGLLLNSLHHIGVGCLSGIISRCCELLVVINPQDAATVRNTAEKFGHILLHQLNTHPMTERGPRQLLHLKRIA